MKRSFKEELHTVILERNLLKNTFRTYYFWTKEFYKFTRKGLTDCSEKDVAQFLTWMNRNRYAGSSRKQALNALVFVYRHVVKKPLGDIGPAAEIKQFRPPVVVPSVEELGRIFSGMSGTAKLMAQMMYGSGLRVGEVCKLRVKDLDFPNRQVFLYQAKGYKHRQSILAEPLIPVLQKHLAWRKALHERDFQEGAGFVELPGRYARKNRSADRSLEWQFLFPSTAVRKGFRWHTTPRFVQKNFNKALAQSGIRKQLTPHSLRKAFATHLHRKGTDVRTIQNLLGHAKLETTLIYLEAADISTVHSPLESV